ncbi:unnamed protein product [Closterium sp. NIES-64]|nr:unnamed protein product [Closterium sp. NIES-64]
MHHWASFFILVIRSSTAPSAEQCKARQQKNGSYTSDLSAPDLSTTMRGFPPIEWRLRLVPMTSAPPPVVVVNHIIIPSLLRPPTPCHACKAFQQSKESSQQAEELRKRQGVGQVVRAKGKVRVFTTYTPKYMKLGKTWGGVGGQGRAGEDVIIGVLDSGIWPEHPSFSDKGYKPVPKRWRGACTGLSRCNRKLIGARYFLKGYEAEYGKLAQGEFRSARDAGGHGTWCAGAAAGNAGVVLTDEFGSTAGPASGMAPRGRLAIYKAIWFNASEGYGHDCDIFAAVDQAVADGVDVLSMSIGSGEDTYFGDLPLLRAVQAGVFLAMAAGNEGPPPMAQKPYGFRTLSNAAPFYLTVAASSTDDDWGFFGRSAQSAKSIQVNGTSLPAAATAVQPTQLSDPMMAPFSSAGPPLNPNKPPSSSPTLTNDLLKPDITAPGITRLAAAPGGTNGQAWFSKWHSHQDGEGHY